VRVCESDIELIEKYIPASAQIHEMRR